MFTSVLEEPCLELRPNSHKPSPNCPFYGRFLFRSAHPSGGVPFVLIAARDNQCALAYDRNEACAMDVPGEAVEWRRCPVIGQVRL
jgi:hypothetical protein